MKALNIFALAVFPILSPWVLLGEETNLNKHASWLVAFTEIDDVIYYSAFPLGGGERLSPYPGTNANILASLNSFGPPVLVGPDLRHKNLKTDLLSFSLAPSYRAMQRSETGDVCCFDDSSSIVVSGPAEKRTPHAEERARRLLNYLRVFTDVSGSFFDPVAVKIPKKSPLQKHAQLVFTSVSNLGGGKCKSAVFLNAGSILVTYNKPVNLRKRFLLGSP